MKNLRHKAFTLLAVVAGFLGVTAFAPPTLAFMGQANAQNSSLKEAQKGADSTGESGRDLEDLAEVILNILSWIIGVAAVIMILIGGLRYVTSNGDSSGIASAKNTIIYAIVGLVIALFAQAIVQFVLKKI